MIEVQHLTKRYGRVTAVEDVSFRVERGEILGFLGPNGAGKTTTMRILTGYMPATEGKAVVAGFDVFDQAVEAKRRTGYLPETPPLYPDMTVIEYLTFVAKIKGVPAAERAQRVKAVMERIRVADMADRLCSKLSKGYRQRVGLAQALVHDPEVLILDEPTSGLDPRQIIGIRNLIKELAKTKTVIFSSHILAEISAVTDRIAIIHEGRIVADSRTEELRRDAMRANRYRVILGADGNDVGGALKALRGVTAVERAVAETNGTPHPWIVTSPLDNDLRRSINELARAKGWDLLELHEERPTLEEAFIELTGRRAA